MKKILPLILCLLLMACGVTDRFNPKPPDFSRPVDMSPPKEFCLAKLEAGHQRLDTTKTYKDCEGKILACFDKKTMNYCLPRVSNDGKNRCLPLKIEKITLWNSLCYDSITDFGKFPSNTYEETIYRLSDRSVNSGYNFYLELSPGVWKGSKATRISGYTHRKSDSGICYATSLVYYQYLDADPIVGDDHFPEMED